MRTWLICLAAFASASAPAQEKPVPPPAVPIPLTAQTFAATPFMERAELSPNGQYVAARISVSGKQVLAMLPVFDKAAKKTLINFEGLAFDVDWWDWVNDDWLVVGVSANDYVESEKFRISRVLSVERATGKTAALAQRNAAQNAGRVIWKARDGTPRILLEMQTSVYVDDLGFWPEVQEVDVSTGKMKKVQGSKTSIINYFSDGSGVVRMGYGYDYTKRTERLIYRPTAGENFKTLDRANLAKKERLSVPDQFLADPTKALAIDNPDGFSAVYEVDLVTLARGKKIFGIEGYDISGIIPNATNDGMAGVYYTDTSPKIHWLDPELAKVQADFDKAVGVGRARIVSWSRDQKLLLVEVGGADQAGAYFIYNRATGGKLQRYAFINEVVKQTKFAPMKTISYKARDGAAIPAVLTLPKDKVAKNLPLILLPHGGPAARDAETWDWWVQFLAGKGYAVVQPNYRGSTGYGSAHYELGDQQWGRTMQDDLNDAVTHLAKDGVVDPKRVCIAGASYGGYAAMRGAQRDGSMFRCAISYAGVSDLAALAKFDSQSLFGKESVSYLKDKAPDFASVSPLRFPEQFSTPILIVHGKNDLRVPVEQSRKMADKLKAAGKDVRYVEQPLGDHHFSRQADRLQFLQEMEAFLAQYNPA